MKTALIIIGWIFSYMNIIALVPFGTCTQGDDDPWKASFFYAGIALIGLLILLVGLRDNNKYPVFGVPHLLSIILILWNITPYWTRTTFQGQHVCTVFTGVDFSDFETKIWHRLWAPLITTLEIVFIMISYKGLKSYIKKYRLKTVIPNH